MGLIGVTSSSDGDLRPGLPLKMIEHHDPVCFLMLVEHRLKVVLRILKASPENCEWFSKGWLHLVVSSPDDGELYHFKDGLQRAMEGPTTSSAIFYFVYNALFRSHQLLVSLSVLNYQIHNQFLHFSKLAGQGTTGLWNREKLSCCSLGVPAGSLHVSILLAAA